MCDDESFVLLDGVMSGSLKVLFVGAEGSGRRCLVEYLMRKSTVESGTTIRRKFEGRELLVELLTNHNETELIGNAGAGHFSDVKVLFGVCDATDPESMKKMGVSLGLVQGLCAKNCRLAILVNKNDLPFPRVAPEDVAAYFSTISRQNIFSVSAATGSGVLEAFEALVTAVQPRKQATNRYATPPGGKSCDWCSIL